MKHLKVFENFLYEAKKYKGDDMTDQDAFMWFKSLPEDRKEKVEKGKSKNMSKMLAQILDKHADEIASWKTETEKKKK